MVVESNSREVGFGLILRCRTVVESDSKAMCGHGRVKSRVGSKHGHGEVYFDGHMVNGMVVWSWRVAWWW